MVHVREDTFGTAINPSTNKTEVIRRFTIANKCMSVQVITYGATITSVNVPDAKGRVADIALGFDDILGYKSPSNPYIGGTVGRVCNSVSNARFFLNGRLYKLSSNFYGKHQLNGGFIGFDKVIWDVYRVRPDGVVFSFCSPDGHEGYPGQVSAKCTYTLTEDNSFRFCLEATTTKPTPVNMTNHAYYNLAGHNSGKKGMYEHNIMIKANHVVDADNESLPTGKLIELKGHPLDLRQMTNIGQRLTKYPLMGYDQDYILDWKPNTITPQAQVYHPPSGRWMQISSNQPCIHFCISRNMPDIEAGEFPTIKGKRGAHYTRHGSFCMETHWYPDAMNHPNFPSVILNPGEKYEHICIFKFGIMVQRQRPMTRK